jgi:hypothetical protein
LLAATSIFGENGMGFSIFEIRGLPSGEAVLEQCTGKAEEMMIAFCLKILGSNPGEKK